MDMQSNSQYQNQLEEYTNTRNKYANAKNEIEREIYYEHNAKLKPPKAPDLNTAKIKELEIRIKELEYEERLKYEDYRNQIADSELKLSGYYERLIID